MAFAATLTGTGRTIGATAGSPNVTVTNTAGFVVGATVVGMAWPAGTKIASNIGNGAFRYISVDGTGAEGSEWGPAA